MSLETEILARLAAARAGPAVRRDQAGGRLDVRPCKRHVNRTAKGMRLRIFIRKICFIVGSFSGLPVQVWCS